MGLALLPLRLLGNGFAAARQCIYLKDIYIGGRRHGGGHVGFLLSGSCLTAPASLLLGSIARPHTRTCPVHASVRSFTFIFLVCSVKDKIKSGGFLLAVQWGYRPDSCIHIWRLPRDDWAGLVARVSLGGEQAVAGLPLESARCSAG